jgi:DNA-binding NtrC family response regulator
LALQLQPLNILRPRYLTYINSHYLNKILLEVKQMNQGLQTALIIDDDKDLCNILSTIIKEQQFKVWVANNLSEGKEIIKKNKPSIIFLDHNLPDGYGIDSIPDIHEVDENIKIIVITADPSGAMRQKVLGEANTYFLSKPFSMRSVHDVLHTIRETA